ncbi:MAG: efflux RND transporter periplasmic adaptor subunit [Vicingaceae bacterium]
MKKNKTAIISGLIFLAAAVLITLIFTTEPTAQSEGATKKSAMLVSVEPVHLGDYTPLFQATGSVRAFEDIQLNALVSGQIIKRNSEFVPGGRVKKGTELLKINPADYRNDLELRKSELQQAQTNLEVELGRQNIAKQDLKLIGGDSLTEDQKNLVLRKPQFSAVQANITAAKAAVNQAQLNLDRTSVKAPFDAQIISQNVSVGSQVAPGDNLGRLVGIEQYWVEVNLPVKKLKYLTFPENDSLSGAKVTIKNTSDWEVGESRKGLLTNRVGALDQQSRLARLLIKIPDPLNIDKANVDAPELMIGSFVEAELEGEKIKNVVRIKRDFLRSNNTVWVMENKELKIRKVKVQLMDAHYAYLSEGLKDGAQVVTTNISTVTEGIPLRTAGEKEGKKDE